MGSGGPSVAGGKRRPPKEFEIEFKVFEHLINPSKKISCVKLAKPHEPDCERKCRQNDWRYPSITVKPESCSNNDHAFRIMLELNHKNILSMKALYKSESDMDLNIVSALVEEYVGLIDPHYKTILADKHGYIPSDAFQQSFRDIVDGIIFLHDSDLYHGNLMWITTLYTRDNDSKLANFREKDALIETRRAKWNDWLAILIMLRIAHKYATEQNADPTNSQELFCENLVELIEIISSADMDSLDVMKDRIVEAMFFLEFREKGRISYCQGIIVV